MIKRLIWTIWTPMSSVLKTADKLNLSLSLLMTVSLTAIWLLFPNLYLMDTCPVCCKVVNSSSHRLKCDCCFHYVHLNCTYMDRNEYLLCQSETYPWSCIICNENMFPFNHILDDTEFMSALPANDLDYINLNSISKLLFVPFEFNEDPSYIPGFEYDPDIHFFNQMSQNITFNSNYYSEEGFKKYVSERNINNFNFFSLYHMNIRSTRNNSNKMLAYLETLNQKFDIIGLSETWLKENEVDLYNIQGYNHVAMPKVYAERGGVSLYVRNIFNYEIRKDLSFRNEYCECLCIEIADIRPVLIVIVYRRPGTDLETFTDFISNKLDIVKSDKHTCYLLGDLNINLLWHNVHRQTKDFLDIMYSNGFIPLINRPTRVTAETATIIDHIYTNYLNTTRMTAQGILVTDITDHYPVFHFSQPFGNSQSNLDDGFFYTRRITQCNMKLFKYLVSQVNGLRYWTNLDVMMPLLLFTVSLNLVIIKPSLWSSKRKNMLNKHHGLQTASVPQS